MKKNLTFLTGIVFLIALLVAGGCSTSPKTDTSGETGTDTETTNHELHDEKEDSTKVDIFLRAIEIDGTMHLQMFDDKKAPCPVVDGLLTEVYAGYTLRWKKATDSNIHKITKIRAVRNPGDFYGAVPEIDTSEDFGSEGYPIGENKKAVFKLDIPKGLEIKKDTLIKYEIYFTVKDDMDTTVIDPYLKLPKQGGN